MGLHTEYPKLPKTHTGASLKHGSWAQTPPQCAPSQLSAAPVCSSWHSCPHFCHQHQDHALLSLSNRCPPLWANLPLHPCKRCLLYSQKSHSTLCISISSSTGCRPAAIPHCFTLTVMADMFWLRCTLQELRARYESHKTGCCSASHSIKPARPRHKPGLALTWGCLDLGGALAGELHLQHHSTAGSGSNLLAQA